MKMMLGLFASMVLAHSAQVTVTAYCKCAKCCGKWAKYAQTASGVKPIEGITCAASRKLPFGTRLYVQGVGTRIVQDRLALKFDDRVDIYFNDHNQALRFGKRRLNVYVTPSLTNDIAQTAQTTRRRKQVKS